MDETARIRTCGRVERKLLRRSAATAFSALIAESLAGIAEIPLPDREQPALSLPKGPARSDS